MRKVNVIEFVSLDGVIQSPGGPEEDTSGGFASVPVTSGFHVIRDLGHNQLNESK